MTLASPHRTYHPARDIVPCARPTQQRELATHDGAAALAAELDEWWAKRGFPQVKHSVVEMLHRHGPIHCIRSNLVNGLPPRVSA